MLLKMLLMPLLKLPLDLLLIVRTRPFNVEILLPVLSAPWILAVVGVLLRKPATKVALLDHCDPIAVFGSLLFAQDNPAVSIPIALSATETPSAAGARTTKHALKDLMKNPSWEHAQTMSSSLAIANSVKSKT